MKVNVELDGQKLRSSCHYAGRQGEETIRYMYSEAEDRLMRHKMGFGRIVSSRLACIAQWLPIWLFVDV